MLRRLNRSLLAIGVILGAYGMLPSQTLSATSCSPCVTDGFCPFCDHYFVEACCETGPDCRNASLFHTAPKSRSCGYNHNACGVE